jgi:hypothetical protein
VLLQAGEQRAQTRDCLDAGERSGGQRQSHTTAPEGAVHIVGVQAVERDRPPHAERTTERQRPLVIGIDQGKRLLARERLDPEGARQAQQRAVKAVLLDQRGAAGGRLGAHVDHVGALAAEKQHGQPVLVTDEGELVTVGEGLDERLGPEVLMNVDLDHGWQPPAGRRVEESYSGDC